MAIQNDISIAIKMLKSAIDSGNYDKNAISEIQAKIDVFTKDLFDLQQDQFVKSEVADLSVDAQIENIKP